MVPLNSGMHFHHLVVQNLMTPREMCECFRSERILFQVIEVTLLILYLALTSDHMRIVHGFSSIHFSQGPKFKQSLSSQPK